MKYVVLPKKNNVYGYCLETGCHAVCYTDCNPHDPRKPGCDNLCHINCQKGIL